MKAVFLDYATMGHGLNMEPLTSLLPQLKIFDSTGDDEIVERIGDTEFVFANNFRLTDEMLAAASQLRYIGLPATGTDNIDLDSAKKHGIAVCNIRGYCTRSVTEHVFAMLLTLAHSLNSYIAAVRDGAWQRSRGACVLTYPVRELSTMTMGIVGHGELGASVARKARDFDMDVIVSARPGSKTVEDGRVSFDELLERSDVISLHCPLNDQTRDLFAADEFQKMKSSAILINTARGALVDSLALVDALKNQQIAAAGIDVLPQEPPSDDDPLLNYPDDNLLVTPHIAWATDKSRQDAIVELATNVADFLKGGERNRVA